MELLDEAPRQKRMRLGTRSCAECRRRKVRCIFPQQSDVCRQCEAHGTSCYKQGIQPVESPVEQVPSDRLTRRIKELERLVDEIYRTNSDEPPTGADARMSPAAALKHLCPTSALVFTGDKSAETGSLPYEEDPSSDAPLLNLLKTALSLENAAASPHVPSLTRKNERTVRALRALILNQDDLTLVLTATQKYWPIWPISPAGLGHFETDMESARTFIHDSFQSDAPLAVTKASLWLALCIQQLSREDGRRRQSQLIPKDTLFEAFLNGGGELLAETCETQADTDFLQCIMLQAKLLVNMGKPRKAWLSIRRGINSALLQGIQHAQGPDSEARRSLLFHLWMTDRQLSMVLGLPYSLPDSVSGLSAYPEGDSVAQYFQSIALVAGRITERNLNFAQKDYLVTLDIERDLLRCWELMPVEWDLPVSVEMPLTELYTRQIGRFYYYFLLKMAHFPYMLGKAPPGRNYDNSRVTALMAARNMISCYHTLRYSSQGRFLICDLTDFQAFSAAIVLVIHLISSTTERNALQDAEDWAMVNRLSHAFGELSQSMTCNVARQASEALQYLHSAAHGSYVRTEPYELVIPYFGKMCITQLRRTLGPDSDGGAMTGSSHDTSPLVNAIQFSTQEFSPAGPEALAYYLGESELSVDWGSLSGFDFNWDWNETFYCPYPDAQGSI